MIIELNEIKEVEIVAKPDFKYFMLFIYNPKSTDVYGKYFLVNQSPNIDDLERYKDSWNLNEGEEFRVFAVMLPA
jgi:DNA polymerase II small subunit/DNA polymerase delta subunit B